MTRNVLALNIGITLYFWIGSIYEERRLVAEFGEAYREHQRRVPRLVPRLWRRKRAGAVSAAQANQDRERR